MSTRQLLRRRMWRVRFCAAWAASAVAIPALAQLTPAQIDELRVRGQKEGWTFTVGENPATKVPLEQLCGLKLPDNWRASANFVNLDRVPMDLPASFDWRTLGGVTPIRDQRGCGSCWAFSTVGPLECAIKIKDGLSVDLSEQWLVSCNRDGWSCNSGWMAHDYLQWKTDACGGTGAVLESSFPYQAADAACGCPYHHPYLITSWAFIGGGTSAIKQAIMTYGPVSAGVYVDTDFGAYTGGIFNSCPNPPPGVFMNHGIVLVGWDDNQGEGVWFLRNSWGPGWGEGGYMRIIYGCSNVGQSACYVDYRGQGFLEVSPEDNFASVGEVGGPFTPQCMTYTLHNSDTSSLNWTATKTRDWLTVTPSAGTLAGGASVDVGVCVNANANGLQIGVYTDQVFFRNTTSGSIKTRDVSLKVGHVDYFTELFATGNDLAHTTVTLTPDGSGHYYAACTTPATAFPMDPTGGAALGLTGDTSVKVTLAQGATVSIYGQAYSEFYVGSNGYITFATSDTDATESLADHFRLKRISGLFTDLAPAAGAVTYKQLLGRVAITWQNVQEVGTSGGNSFQIEMFFDGRIRMTWLDLAASDGLAGLSRGAGQPADFVMSNLTGYTPCPHPGDANGDGDVDLEDFGHLQACMTGAGVRAVNPSCGDADLDMDGDVDRWDLQRFMRCLAGPEMPIPAGCLDGSPP